MSILETYRLRLRPFTFDDVESFYEQIHGSPDVMRFLEGPRPKESAPTTLQAFMEQWRTHRFGMWALEDRSSRAFIGQVGLNIIPNTSDVEVVVALAKSQWGKGLATEAAAAVIGYGLDVAGLNVLYALAMPENVAYQRVLAKLGMKFEGVVNRYYQSPMLCYFLTADESVTDKSTPNEPEGVGE